MNSNIWSLHYCFDVFGITENAADTWEKSELRFFRSGTDAPVGFSAEVTRVIGPQHGLDMDPISFVVEGTRGQSGNSRYFSIKFNEDSKFLSLAFSSFTFPIRKIPVSVHVVKYINYSSHQDETSRFV